MTGLDYSAMYQVAHTLDIEVTPGLLQKIQALEEATIRHLRNKK